MITSTKTRKIRLSSTSRKRKTLALPGLAVVVILVAGGCSRLSSPESNLEHYFSEKGSSAEIRKCNEKSDFRDRSGSMAVCSGSLDGQDSAWLVIFNGDGSVYQASAAN